MKKISLTFVALAISCIALCISVVALVLNNSKEGFKMTTVTTVEQFVNELGKKITIDNIEKDYSQLPIDYNPDDYLEEEVFPENPQIVKIQYNQDYYSDYIYSFVGGIGINRPNPPKVDFPHPPSHPYPLIQVYKVKNDKLLKAAAKGTINVALITFTYKYIMEIGLDAADKLSRVDINTAVNGEFIMVYANYLDNEANNILGAFYSINT